MNAPGMRWNQSVIMLFVIMGGVFCGARAAQAVNINIRPSSPAVGNWVTFTAAGCEECEEYWWEFRLIGSSMVVDGGEGYLIRKKFSVPGTYWVRVTTNTGDARNVRFSVAANAFTVNVLPSAGCTVTAGDGGVDVVEAPNGIVCSGTTAASDPLCTEQFKNSDIAALKVVPDTGYVFTGWTVNGAHITLTSAEPLLLTTMPVLAQNGNSFTPTPNPANVGIGCQGASITAKFRIIGYENQVEYEMAMSEITENQVTFFRTLGGARIHLEADIPSGMTVETYTWSADQGTFYDGYALAANELTGSALSDETLHSIYWQGIPQANVNATITLTLTLAENSETVSLSKTIRSRTLKENLEGDDVKMLQAELRSLGLSEPTSSGLCSGVTYGYCGTPVSIQDSFTADLKTTVIRFQRRDELSQIDGSVGSNTLSRITLHWNDYLAAFETYIQSPVINSTHQDFNTWLTAGSETLDDTFNDLFASQIASQLEPIEIRKRLLYAWTLHETEARHWGFQIPYRIHLGGYDNRGSIGFSQIQNRFKYGLTAGDSVFDGINLYHPSDNIKGFGLWSGEQGAKNFYHAFISNEYNGSPTEIDYPKLKNAYFTNGVYNVLVTDRLAKGLAGFKQGTYVENDNGTRVLFHEIWPEMLRKYPNDTTDSNSDVKKAIRYALQVQNITLPGEQSPIFDLNTREWDYVKQVGNQESVCCTYSEYDWLTGTSWTQKCQTTCQ